MWQVRTDVRNFRWRLANLLGDAGLRLATSFISKIAELTGVQRVSTVWTSLLEMPQAEFNKVASEGILYLSRGRLTRLGDYHGALLQEI